VTESINWGAFIDEADAAFTPIPEGNHTFRVKTAEATRSSTDKLMFKLVCELVSGPDAGKTAYNNIVMTEDNPKAMFFFFKNLEALGCPKSWLRTEPRPNPDQVAARMVGAVFTADITHRDWNGSKSENFNNLKAAQGSAGGGAPLTSQPAASAPAGGVGPSF